VQHLVHPGVRHFTSARSLSPKKVRGQRARDVVNILARCILQNTTRRLWSLVRILSRLSLCTRHTYIGILGSRYYYFLYTTYHTPSNTKSSELHFCVRNNSGNSGILRMVCVAVCRCCRCCRCCCSICGVCTCHCHCCGFYYCSAVLLLWVWLMALPSFLLFYSTIHDGKIARSLRCSVSAGNIKPPSSCTPRQLRRPL